MTRWCFGEEQVIGILQEHQANRSRPSSAGLAAQRADPPQAAIEIWRLGRGASVRASIRLTMANDAKLRALEGEAEWRAFRRKDRPPNERQAEEASAESAMDVSTLREPREQTPAPG